MSRANLSCAPGNNQIPLIIRVYWCSFVVKECRMKVIVETERLIGTGICRR